MSEQTWRGDWITRIYQRVRELPEGPDDPVIERAFAGVRFDAPVGDDDR